MRAWVLSTVLMLALGVAFLLSGMESGVFTLSRFRIRRLARQGDRRAVRLQHYLDHPERFLWTILIGNTLAAWVVITLVTLQLEQWLGAEPMLFMPAVGTVLFLLYVFADLFPKLLFRRLPNRLCLAGVGSFRLVDAALAPVVGAAEVIANRLSRVPGGRAALPGRLPGSRAELRQVMQDSSSSLSREEMVMINRILDLQNLRVRDVMTPMDRAVTLDAGLAVSALLDLVRERHVSYIPLWKGTGAARRVLGVVALSSVLYEENIDPATPLEQLVQPAMFLDETVRLEDALRVIQRGRQRLAVVLNAQRAESGVITLNDILRVMFGELRI
jgi:CBS domain containing-hemolysin-like protein